MWFYLRILGVWRASCPRCGSGEVRRSARRNWVERAMSAALLPYRCEWCYQRYFRVPGIGRRDST